MSDPRVVMQARQELVKARREAGQRARREELEARIAEKQSVIRRERVQRGLRASFVREAGGVGCDSGLKK
jgi:hypothetical protein